MRSGATNKYFAEKERRCIERVFGKFLKIPESKVPTDYGGVMIRFERCLNLKFNKVLELLETLLNDRYVEDVCAKRIGACLRYKARLTG